MIAPKLAIMSFSDLYPTQETMLFQCEYFFVAVKGNPDSHHDDHAQKCVYKSRQLRRPLSEELHRNTDTVEIEHVVAHHAKRENE